MNSLNGTMNLPEASVARVGTNAVEVAVVAVMVVNRVTNVSRYVSVALIDNAINHLS